MQKNLPTFFSHTPKKLKMILPLGNILIPTIYCQHVLHTAKLRSSLMRDVTRTTPPSSRRVGAGTNIELTRSWTYQNKPFSMQWTCTWTYNFPESRQFSLKWQMQKECEKEKAMSPCSGNFSDLRDMKKRMQRLEGSREGFKDQ